MQQEHDDVSAILHDLGLDHGAALRIAGEQVELRFLRQLGERLLADGLTHAELGRRLGLQRSQIRRWMSGDSSVKLGVAAALAAAAGYECEVVLRPLHAHIDYAAGQGANVVVALGQMPRRAATIEPTRSTSSAA